jgi:NADH-quinone oxidoreductase subunit N
MTFDAVKALSGPLFVILWGMIVLLLDLGESGAARRRALPLITIVGLAVAAMLSVVTVASGQIAPVSGTTLATTFFGGGMVADEFGALFCVILCVAAGLSVLMSGRYLEERGINQGEFYSLLLFSTAGAMLMALSFDLVNVFVGLEILSVSLYILSGFARRARRSEEAAVKYFLLGAFASGFLLYGTALIYGAVGFAVQNQPWASSLVGHSYTNFYVIGEALRATQSAGVPLLSAPLFVAGIGMVIVGLGFKAAIVPFHSYAPDVYEGAPTPVTAFMSVAAKAGAFAALLRIVQVLAAAGVAGPFHNVLWGLAAATMIVGNVLAVRQTNLKRMLAYSSIAHAGYILVGVLASASLDPAAALYAQGAVRYYLLAYTFMNAGALALIIWLGPHDGGEYLEISEYHGLAKRNPMAAAVLSLFMISLAGLPPTAGFVGKLFLFQAAFRSGENVLAVIGLVVSAIGVFYYLGIIATMYFQAPKHEQAFRESGGAKAAALIAAIATVLFGLVPAATGAFAPAAVSVANSPVSQP